VAEAGAPFGVLLGRPTSVLRYPRHPGLPVLAVTTVLAGVVTVVGGVPAGPAPWGLLAPLLPLAALTGVTRLVRAAWPPPAGGRTGLLGRPRREMTSQLLRVLTPSGAELSCELRGEPAGARLRAGDPVRLYGRRTRRGSFVVLRIELLLMPDGPVAATVTGRVPGPVWLNGWISRLSVVLSAALVVWVGYRAASGR